MEDIQYDVFISYSRKDYVDEDKHIIPGNAVSEIKELLKDNNISYWFDEEGINHGDAFAEKIATNIEKSLMVLFLSSSNANQSKWTNKEISTATQWNKHILPVRLDDSAYNKSVMFYISDLDFVEYYENKEVAQRRILHSIREKKAEYEKQKVAKQKESTKKAQKELYDKLEKDIDTLCVEEQALDGRHASIHNRILSIEDTALQGRLLAQLEQSNPAYYKELLQTRALLKSLETQKQQIAELEQAKSALEQGKKLFYEAKTQLSNANKEASETKQQLITVSKELADVKQQLENKDTQLTKALAEQNKQKKTVHTLNVYRTLLACIISAIGITGITIWALFAWVS